MWSLGAAGTQILFNGGLTSAQVDAAHAVYWQSVANYRQTVLTAFQGVEDQLASIRQLTLAFAAQRQAVKDAQQAVDVCLNQFEESLRRKSASKRRTIENHRERPRRWPLARRASNPPCRRACRNLPGCPQALAEHWLEFFGDRERGLLIP
jgi:hypothetical protein